MRTDIADGLEGIVVAETRTSLVDGAAGRLVIAGRDLEDLAGNASFEETCSLLWRRPARVDLGPARVRAFELLPRVQAALARSDGMEALRGAVAQLSTADLGEDGNASLTGAAAVLVAAWIRLAARAQPLPPDPARGHAADLLRMAGLPHDADPAAALDAYLVTVSEHGMNASTFTARVVASTASDPVSAVTAAIGALKGPRHGGAPGPVLDMLDAVKTGDRARAWIEAELAAKNRIMGMGHRVYRVRDPRAAVLERAITRLGERRPTQRLDLARTVERVAEEVLAARHPGRALRANVEFYTAVLLEALGVPRAAFTPVFAAARMAGWCAHVAEQLQSGRLIRPDVRYIGALPG
jgi:citrate synthase